MTSRGDFLECSSSPGERDPFQREVANGGSSPTRTPYKSLVPRFSLAAVLLLVGWSSVGCQATSTPPVPSHVSLARAVRARTPVVCPGEAERGECSPLTHRHGATPVELLAESHCEKQLERAIALAREAVRLATEKEETSVAEAARFRLAELERDASSLSLAMPSGALALDVRVDGLRVGAELARAGVRVAPGRHRVEILDSSDDLLAWGEDVCVTPGRDLTVAVVLSEDALRAAR